MHDVAEETTSWIPLTDDEKDSIRQQMNRLLETKHFKNSRRYPALFRFMVEETLEGRGDYLKERLLGISVLGRPAGYDTAADPTVRVSVAEIRKRIAQYYHEEAHDGELRIDIQPGRYQAEFRFGREADTPHRSAPTVSNTSSRSGLPLDATPRREQVVRADSAAEVDGRVGRRVDGRLWNRRPAVLLLLLLACLCAAGQWRWRSTRASGTVDVWAPLLDANGPVVITIAGGPKSHDSTAMHALLDQSNEAANAGTTAVVPLSPAPTFLNHMVLDQNVVLADALAMGKVVDLLARDQRAYQIRLSGDTRLDDLRQGPGVLIGGLDNSWTLRAVAGLRYRFDADNNYQCWISDTKYPVNKAWLLDLKKPYQAVTEDYAIVARIHNEQTGQTQLVAAGLGMSGTVAASELLVDSQLGRQLRQRVGAGLRSRDFEAVIRTDVVNGIGGPPIILAVDVR